MTDDSIRSKFPRKPQFFTVAEVAVICNVEKKQVYAWIDEGRVRAFRLGRGQHVLRIHTKDLDQLVEDLRDEWRRDHGVEE